jgi:CubicO group peptidase (beta-lactamase class C family)
VRSRLDSDTRATLAELIALRLVAMLLSLPSTLALAALASPMPPWRSSAAPTASQNAASSSAARPSAPTPRGLTTRGELEAFLDGLMAANMRDEQVAGATISVVKDGELFFAKGYGFADLEKRAPVDPEKTLFRIGSVSKLFTWTAVMQLVEQGELSLDADVNTYLDFEIPKTFPQPITLRHVMTHTTGFEDDARDLFLDDASRVVPLGRWLATHVPGRVREPGTYASYSNYAAAVAGYVVERVARKPWEEVIEQRILVPLGMDHTSVRQPLPADLRDDMSQGYVFDDGLFAAMKWEIVGAAPAGSVSSSAADMAKFMLAHLGKGSLGSRRILAESTVERMHARAFTHDEHLNGMALGFYEKSSHGLRIIGHNGDTLLFHTDLALIPSERVGIFVSYNTSTGRELSRFTLLTEFLDHYYAQVPLPAATQDAREELESVAGEYFLMRRSYTTFQKVGALSGAAHVDVTDTGNLVLRSTFGTHDLVRVGPRLYRDAEGESLYAFDGDDSSPAPHLFLGDVPPMAMERVRWFELPELHWALLGISIATFLGVVAAAARRTWRRMRGRARPGDALPGRALLVAAASCNLAFAIVFAALASDPIELVTSPMTPLRIALALPVLGLAFTLGASIAALRQWRARAGTRGARLGYGAAVILSLVFAWSLGVWNLLSWHL